MRGRVKRLTDKDTTDELQGSTGNVPGVVVAGAAHELAIEQVEGDEEENEGQEVDGCLESRATASELVVEGKVEDADEAAKGGQHHGEEEANHAAALPEVHGEQAVLEGGADQVDLLEHKEHAGDTGGDPKTDAAGVVPVPEDAAKVHCHDDHEQEADGQERAEVVDLSKALAQGYSGLGLEVGQDPEVDGSTDNSDEQVEVEGPAPGSRAFSKAASDDGTQNGADTPDEASQTQILGALDVGGGDGQQGQQTHVHATATDAGQGTTDDEGVDVGSTSTQC